MDKVREFKGRRVRLDSDDVFQVGDAFFDRWANSLSISFNLGSMEHGVERDVANWAKHFVEES